MNGMIAPVINEYEDLKRVLPNGGLLLEHFARLAASVVGTSAAVVSVLGRGKGQRLRHAAFGLAREQLIAVEEIERILGSGPAMTIVPDLTLDDRFGRDTAGFEDPRFRFVAYVKLTSPGGERVGFICLLDEHPRRELTETQASSLGHIASMILADRQREQRHLHLMHVAERALRVDEMLRLVSGAASCADALTNLLEALCHFHGAAAGHIWQLTRPDKPLVEISHYHKDNRIGTAYLNIEPLAALNEMMAEAIRRNKPHAIKFSEFAAFEGAAACEFSSHVCIPIWVHQQRFGISLAFTAENSELEQVVADIASLGDTIRPALFQKVTEERMRFAAHHDVLTGLPNRALLEEKILSALRQAVSTGRQVLVMFIDLDGFKGVNDILGHLVGDQLLKHVAKIINSTIGPNDFVARLGGDEFIVVRSDVEDAEADSELANLLIDCISDSVIIEDHELRVSASIGISVFPRDGLDHHILFKKADIALYRAKAEGRATYRTFEPGMDERLHHRVMLEEDLRHALDTESLQVHYQPEYESATLRLAGFEALARWDHPKHGWISPEIFIGVAEEAGLIGRLGAFVLERACEQAMQWPADCFIAVNVSAIQLLDTGFVSVLKDILKRTGMPANRLELELTESVMTDSGRQTAHTLASLHELGISLALDDFGTGYSSLSNLLRFRFDKVKIDRSFIQEQHRDSEARAILEAILAMSRHIGLKVTAEGVETQEQLAMLKTQGCSLIQGHLLGRPVPGSETMELVFDRQRFPEEHPRPVHRLMLASDLATS